MPPYFGGLASGFAFLTGRKSSENFVLLTPNSRGSIWAPAELGDVRSGLARAVRRVYVRELRPNPSVDAPERRGCNDLVAVSG
jgi:hypothetical protein